MFRNTTTFDQSLRRTASRLPVESLPENAQARFLATLPTVPSLNKRRRFLASGIALAGVATACFITGSLVSHQAPFVTRSYAAEIQRAIAQARTWHFVGWRSEEGKRVRWEVWGRRSPFLYRETIGEETVFDDGVRRVHLLPPDPLSGRNHGTYLVTAGESLRGGGGTFPNQSRQVPGYLSGISSDNIDFREFSPRPGDSHTLFAETVNDFMGRSVWRARTTLDVSAFTFLPTRYQTVRERYPEAHTSHFVSLNAPPEKRELTAELAPQYDIPVPTAIMELPTPRAGYTIINSLENSPKLPTDGSVCSRKGVTVQAEVLGQDTEGNLRLRFHAWVGDAPLNVGAMGCGLNIGIGEAINNEMGTSYVYLSSPPWASSSTETPEQWLAITEPLTPGSPTPKTLHLTVPIQLGRYQRVGESGTDVRLVSDNFHFVLPLPITKAPLGWDETPDSFGVFYEGVRPTFRLETAEARAEYYNRVQNSGGFVQLPNNQTEELETSLQAKRAALTRGEYWNGVVLSEATRTKNRMMQDVAKGNLHDIEQRKAVLQKTRGWSPP